ncbi:MAG: diguanylate cyclase [Desulfomicrobium apsheronum]|nr:diguanylate cyclase [Desulfomicrobium apsheronum]
MNIRISVRTKLFLSHILIVVFIAGTAGTYFYLSAVESLMNGLKERLQASAGLISQTLDAEVLRHIRAEEDTASPEYAATLDQLRTLKRMNPDIAFLYVMRLEAEKVFFIIDSDETNGQALPGKNYDHDLPTLRRGFTSMIVDDEISTDEWGSFLSGYAPIKNAKGQYLVGIDMRADQVREKYSALRISGAVSLFAAILLAFILARILANRFMMPIRVSISRCSSIAEGRYDEQLDIQTNDELDRLIEAINKMSSSLSLSQRTTQAAVNSLHQAKNELEIRVRQRTADLSEVNNKLSQEVAERLVAQKALQEAATIDPLTRLFNRRVIQERLDLEVARNSRQNTPFTLIIVDLDHFKMINDTHGHDAGDSILVETGVRMKGIIRGQDTLARWGGEEFMMLLPDTDAAGGLEVAEKVRVRIADTTYYFAGQEIRITASFGVAQYDGDLDRATMAADKALYQAKSLGRNRVVLADAES